MSNAVCPCCATPSDTPVTSLVDAPCSRCGHRWRSPAAPLGSGNYYASLVQRNDLQAPWFQQKTAERAVAVTQLLTPQVRRVLEVGCAEGALGHAIKAVRQIVYEGVELSQDANHAREVLDHVFQTPAALVESAPYDLIVSFHVLEHIADVEAELHAWRKLLAPSGRILIEVPHRAGNPLLECDRNPEHLHQFTPASLTVLLASAGLSCHHLSLGHYESPVYCDSIRVLAQLAPSASDQRARLLERFRQSLGGPFVAYGIGGDFYNYVLPVAHALDIRVLVDSASEKWGQQVGPYTITAYDPAVHAAYHVLICSIKFRQTIRKHLRELGVAPERLVDLSEIYDHYNASNTVNERF